MIVVFGGEKGGTGKSTLATNVAVALARAGKDILLVDTDKQGSAAAWAAARTNQDGLAPVHCLQKTGDVSAALRDVGRRYGHVIVDAGGRDSKELRTAMAVADRLWIPIKASQFDLWTVAQMNELVGLARGINPGLDAWVVVAMAPTNPSIHETDEAHVALTDFPELRLAGTTICERKAYRDALPVGKGVLELDNPKAIQEIETLTKEVIGEPTAVQHAAAQA